MAIKTHMERIVSRPDVTITGTLCNRMAAGEDINSTDNEAEVTCKFCQRIMNRRRAS